MIPQQSVFHKPSTAGFTLIETLIYIALFGIILTGIIASSYPLMVGTEKLNQKVTEESEASFVFQKIGASLSSVSTVSAPGGNTLTVDPLSGSPYSFALNNGAIEEGGVPITASRAVFSSFSAWHVLPPPGQGNAPHTVTVTLVVGGKTYTQTYNVYY